MPKNIRNKKITLTHTILGAVMLGICAFVFGNIKDLVLGTPLAINNIRDGASLEDGFLPITGIAKHARSVSVNGRAVYLDRDGNFTDAVILSPGYNIIEVAHRDQFGKEKTKTYHVVFDKALSVARVLSETNYK